MRGIAPRSARRWVCPRPGEPDAHGARGLELSPEGLNDLRQDAGVPCEGEDRHGRAGGREEGTNGTRAGARPARGGGPALRGQRGQGGSSRSAEGQAGAGHAAGPPPRPLRQSPLAHPAQGPHSPRWLRRVHVQGRAEIVADPPAAAPAAPTAGEVYDREFVPALFGPWAADLVGRAALAVGARVLDVACGTGVVARLLPPRVGPTGRVVGLDLDPGMLAAARAATAGLPVSG